LGALFKLLYEEHKDRSLYEKPWQIRSRVTVNNLMAWLVSNNYERKGKTVIQCLENIDPLEMPTNLPEILRLHNYLIKKFSGRLALSDVEDMTIQSFCEKFDHSLKGQLMIARKSQNNEPVSNARGSVNIKQNGSNTMIVTDAEFESDGSLFVSIGSNGPYSIEIQAEGFITHHLECKVNCTSADCNPEKMVVISPLLSPGETRIMMSWDELPADVDIHVMSVKMSDGSLCRTYYSNKRGCESISQDLDNTNGGFNGAETVTLLNNTVNMTEQPLEVKISKPENEQNIGMDPNAKVEKQ